MKTYTTPNSLVFQKLAESVNQLDAMEYILDYHQTHHPEKDIHVHAIFEVSAHSSLKRFHVINSVTGEIQSLHAAHGKASEGDKNDGYATFFSNVPNSCATSLGLNHCAETYTGEHGRSMRLDGLEETNSNMRERACVVHGSNYVYESNQESGHSWGCPALAMDKVQHVIDQLHTETSQPGGYLYIYVRKTNSSGQPAETIKKGSQGVSVEALQEKLSLPKDGKFGSITEDAVIKYQSAHGLVADGIVGPLTWESLYK